MAGSRLYPRSVNETLKAAPRSGEAVLPRLGDATRRMRAETQALLTEIRSVRADIRRRLWVVAAVVVVANVTLINLLP